ncbi:MAG: hypothetical protein CM1200mP18_14820 [Gammaproteobacteria bacterium]|nr:MAG: hypothetical protein CM1200mP18_14820 [Gammaproteobacteria bacterium]
MKMTLKLAVLSVLASFLVFGSVAQAGYPEKPVTFIVPGHQVILKTSLPA